MRIAGVQVSSNCPDFTAQIKPARKANATARLASISMRMTDMLQFSSDFDFGYRHFVSPARFAARLVAPHANSTTDIELTGIRIAQITGDNMPAAAMLMPARL